MGDILANAFERPVFLFDRHQPSSFFPSFCPPNDNPPICLIFLEKAKHYVACKMSPGTFPVAEVFPHWARVFKPEALEWRKRYNEYFLKSAGVFVFRNDDADAEGETEVENDD